MPRYLVGIDLGTTNTAVAYVDTTSRPAGGPKLHTFLIPQVVAVGQVREQPLLPSFLYLPGPHDLPPGAIDLPWKKNPPDVCGEFARSHGAKVPGRLVTSAKSWLCHPGVDRTAPLLPWAAPPEVPRLSPLEVSARYLRHVVEAWNAAAGRQAAEFLEDQEVVITVPASFDDVARNLTAEAARLAGLRHVTLLEEPQAAFYAWLGTHPPAEAAMLKPGMRCLVVDVGGGTTDFSLIRAGEERGELTFVREAVGDHLLLGGDNMDLALAKAVESRLPGGRLDAARFAALVQACRAAKEALLASPPPPSFPVTVMGQGRAVVGGTVSVNLTPEDVTGPLFEGFFPHCPFDARPVAGPRTGLQEMGLPYVSDPAITRHLAAFLRQHLGPGGGGPATVDAVLFNGGVFQPEVLRQRVIEVMRPWFATAGRTWEPLVLTSPSLDLAVSWGAAYYAWLRHSGGRRIGGGIPRSYYVAVEAGGTPADGPGSDPSRDLAVVCVVPRHLQEGDEVRMSEPVLELALGEPVLFPLYSSTVRGDDQPGQVLRLPPESLLRLPPLHTVLRGGKRAGVKRVPVTLSARCTEIGTLELFCETKEGNRWRLEFNVRDVLREPTAAAETEAEAAGPVVDVFPEEKVQAAGAGIRAVFGPPEGTNPPPSPADLPRLLEGALDAPRSEWPTGLCRRLWPFLEETAAGRGRSPAHLARWYNLVGFVLRPGFGDPLDRYRVEALWKLITAAASTPASVGSGGKKPPVVPEGGADYWIMWRRVSGGLNAALQQALFTRLRPTLLPARGKAFSRPPANEYAEMWRAAASLERLDARTKEQLGQAVLKDCKKSPVPTYAFWSLTRLGARVLLYGPLNAVVHPQVVEQWVDELLPLEPATEGDRTAWLFCLSQLVRRTGLRAVDVSEPTRQRVLEVLHAHPCPDVWKRMAAEVVADGREQAARLFGESLPIGLRLTGG